MLQPLNIKFSYVASLLCINLYTTSDFEGGMSLFQMVLAQWAEEKYEIWTDKHHWETNLQRLSVAKPNCQVCDQQMITWETRCLKLGKSGSKSFGIFHWLLKIKSLTLADKPSWRWIGIWKEWTRTWLPHHLKGCTDKSHNFWTFAGRGYSFL
jgi:hypothetical protein